MAARFDIVVVGLGHAGCEAALAAARLGLSVLGVTLRASGIAVMSCNPAIGGTAKGHLVRELDALGGEMGRAADVAGTHFRTLNASRGPAVQATRVLCDREAYAAGMQATLRAQGGLTLWEGEVVHLERDGGRMRGVRLADGREAEAGAVVLTTGTFLQALMHEGDRKQVGGRIGDAAATGLSGALRALGLELGRFKTGTPARLLARSIDWDACERQPGESPVRPFSARTRAEVEAGAPFPSRRQLDCHLTWTQEATHRVLRENLERSPLFCGDITGRGPRYCPSLEDKVVRFAARERHQVFLEPEGEDSPLVYPAGLSTSMPAEVQLAFLRTIPGLEAVEVARYGYAVEYDYAPPTQLSATLEVHRVPGLFLAGQLNGTSGYEEAAVQGFLAGVNAALLVRRARGEEAPPLVLGREEAHAGVLVDELVRRGVDEPFRMMTARSEHRLVLREGNAEVRLLGHARRLGLRGEEALGRTEWFAREVDAEVARLRAGGLDARLRRPEVTWAGLRAEGRVPAEVSEAVGAEAEVVLKYEGYVEQARRAARREADAWDGWRIPEGLAFTDVRGLSAEAVERLARARPATVGQARALQGLTPAALSLLLVHLERLRRA